MKSWLEHFCRWDIVLAATMALVFPLGTSLLAALL